MTVLPFDMEIWGGLGKIKGLLRTTPGGLSIEYTASFLELYPVHKNRELVLPADRIRTCRLHEGWFGTRLDLLTDSMTVWGDFPTNQPGSVALNLRREDRDAARALVDLFAEKTQAQDNLAW